MHLFMMSRPGGFSFCRDTTTGVRQNLFGETPEKIATDNAF